jgi:hypothetical protein
VHRGLEYLAQTNRLLIREQLNVLQTCICYENKKFSIQNSSEQQIYTAIEGLNKKSLKFLKTLLYLKDTGACVRILCHQYRGFVIQIFDNFNQARISFF